MTTTRYNFLALVAVAGILLTGGLLWRGASANPSQFAPTKETAAASTTLAYLTPGTGTTTLSYDSYVGDSVKIDKLTLAVQYTASSTAPTLKVRFEDSMDNVNWYPRLASVPVGTLASTASTTQLATPFNESSLTFSTTTDNGGSGTSGRVHGSFTVDAPMRYVRAIFYDPAGGGNGGLWAQMIPAKELNGR